MNDNTSALPTMEGGGIDEQVLKDFIATAQESNYDYDLVMPKFPELAGYDLQILKDYIATAEENSYDYAAVNAKFPELFEVKKKDEPTEFISEDGFSEPSEATPSVGVIESNQQLSDEDRAAIGGIDLAPEDPRVAEQNRLLEQDYEQRYSPEAQAKFAARELEDAATIDRETKKSDAEALQLDIDRAAAVSLPEVEDVLAQVNPALIDLEEEEVVEKMRSLFKGRGFTFEEIGLGMDRMRVRTTDGLYSLDIDLDNFTNSADVAESAALQVFLRKHFNPTLLPESQDEITKALRAQQMRGTQELWNEDGSASTVRFMSYEEDGVHKVAPTLFPKSTTQPSSPRAEDWLQLDMGAAIEEAERRGEVISFDSQEEAEAFAEGSWKTMNLVDLEAQQFFNERGRDYISDRNAYDNYANSQEARLFLEEQIEIQQDNRWDDAGQFDDLTPEEQAAYGKYFRKDGSLRSDATDIVEALDEGEGNLWDIVNNDDYRRAQEDLDVHLEGIHRKTAQEAANLNYEAKYIEQGLEAQSLEEFGVNLEQLTTYQPKTEQERVRIEEMTEVQLRVQTKKQTAALKYETALTYYDAKANKEASQEYLDNLEGWAVATNDGYKNGRAAQQLLYLSMGIYDVEDEAQLELAATRMTDYMNSVDGRQSRALSRYNSAEDGWNREVRGALSRDPIETMMTWAGASLSQIVPYGAKIIPSFAAAGASAGALAGLAGGPYAPLTSAAGALTGGGWGVRAGFAATNLVLEYTNGVLDAARELKYNMNDPEEAVKAFQNPDVWARGKERGLKRGIPIAIMDLISSGLAGRVFTGVSVASRTRKAAGFVAERFTLDPALEASGELLAQISVGDELSLKEIIAEAGGAVGSKTTMAAYNIYRATRGGYNQRIAAELMDVKLMAADRASDSQVQTWANNMLKLKRITPEQNQRILENLGVRKEANDLLGVAGPSRVGIGSRQRGRVMELLSIRDGLEETSTRRSVFSKEISRINNELSEISRTGKLSESPIDLKTFNTIGGTRTQAPSYRIGSVLYSKSDFLEYIENLTPRRVARIVKNSEVTNDEETSILLDEKLKPFDTSVSEQTTDNAIQEPSTTEVDVQQPTTDSEEVGTGDVVEETAETAEAQDEVAPTPEQPEVLEVSDRATREDVDAFRNETIAPERKSALLAGVAKRQNDGKKLTKFQQEMADANAFEIAELQPKLLEQDAVALEAADLEAAIAADEVSKPQVKVEEKTVAVVAPYFNTTIATVEDAATLRENDDYKAYKKTLVDTGKNMGIEVEVEETIGGFKNEAGEKIVEISNRIVLKNATLEQAEEYAALMGALTPEVQEATIAAQYVKEGAPSHNANEYTVRVEDSQAAIDALKVAGITDYTLNETTGDVTFIYGFDFRDETLQIKIGRFVLELETKGINHEREEYKPIASRYIGAGQRKEILSRVEKTRADLRQSGDVVRKAVNKAIKRDAKFQGTTTKEYKKPKPPEFRIEGESLGVSQDKTDAETLKILEAMNKSAALTRAAQAEESAVLKARLEASENKTGPKLDAAKRLNISQRIDELKQEGKARETEGKATKIDVAELNSRLDNPLPVVSWKVVEGVPMIFNISDQLRTGDIVNPLTGTLIDNLKGGLGFTGVEGHQDMAWASVTIDKAQGQIDSATKVYNDNTEIFERWWASHTELVVDANGDTKVTYPYYGLVPMAIVKMGQSSIMSNEAVVRVLADNLTSFSKTKRTAAMSAFKRAAKQEAKAKEKAIKTGKNEKGEKLSKLTLNAYRSRIADIADVMAMIGETNPKTIDDILTPDALSVLKGITSVNVITDLIMSGNPNTVGEAKKTPGKAKKAVPAVLLGENPSKEDRAKLNAGVVTDLITEPQLEGVPQRSVFIIQGVDVLNPGVLSTNHPNYPVGPRGKTIGILEQPQSVIDLFPSVANNVQLGISKENRGGKRRTERSRLTQVIPVQAGLPNTEFVGSIAGISQRASVLDFLNRAFPSVNVSVDTETFNNVMASEGVKEYLKGDDVIYGVTKDGDIYLNPDVHSSESALYNTAIHEFGHIWTDYLQTTPKGKKVYAKGVELVSKTDEYQNQLKKFRGTTDENGDILTEEQVKNRAVNETMAILIGNKGETIVNASLKQQFQEWLNAAWTYIKETFKMSADLKVVEIQALTLDEFLGTALADIMSGKAIKMTEVQVKKLKNPEAAFSMSDSMTDIISRGRAEGFSEASIRQVLLARGYSSANVKASMAVNMDLFSDSVVPFEFGNIEGGMAAGIRLFQSIQSKVADFAAPNERRTGVRMTAREREQRIFDLREDHPSLLPEEVSDASLLRRFPRRGQQAETVTTQKTPGEVRAKALEVLRDNDVFKAQTEAVQMELVVAIDRAIGIRANRAVSKEITAIRTNLTQRKRAVREVEAVKRQLRQFIRRSLPKSSTYSQADINKLVRSVERVNEANYRVQVEKILQVVEKQRAKMRTAVLKKLLKDVTAGASRSVTTRKLNRAKSLSPEGRAFSVEFKRVLKLAMLSTDEEAVSKLQKLVETLETDEALEAFTKDAAGEVLTQKEHQYINLAAALDLAKNLDTMSLEEVEAMANDYKVAASQSRQYLSETRKARARKSAAIRQKITDAMRRSNPELFNENGTLKDTNEDRAVMDAVREYWNEGKGEGLSPRVKGQVKAAKLYFETYRARSIPKLLRSMVDSIKHLGTFLSAINDTVHEEIFNRLNKLDNNSLRGYFKEQDFLSSLGYETVQQGLFDTKMYKIEGLISTKNKTRYNTSFSKDQLLRFYALSLNPVQRRKLAAQGIDEEKMDGIKKHLGKEAIDFADKVVQYLSTEYYESVNDVYRDINDANLSYVENYFPTMTTQSDVNSTQLFQGDFNGIFNAESAPALRNRTDMTSDIDLKGAAFSTALESHIKTMEHYKAYAADVKALNTILNTSALDATLGKYGIRTLVKQSINNAINPDSGRNALSETGKAFNTLQTQFTAFALAFKAMQVLKQATSFINAFEQYSYRKGKKIGWTADFFIDILPFIADYTAVLINMRKYHNLFKDISPTYRYRVQQGVKGDLAALESGSPTQTGLEYATTKRAKAWRGYKRAGASPTVAGDILGVMGYAANFRRDIKNGMSEEDAVAKFNEYNATQQTRRASERSILQQNSNFLVRAFTMFGSTPILLTNNVMQASNSIWKDITQGKTPKETDVRKLVLNLGMANAAFVAMANIGILLDGDDEERKEVLRKILLAAAGLNLLYQIPFVGATAKEIENWITGNRRPTRGGVNPFISLISKIKKAERDDKLVLGGIQVMGEIAIGAQIDPLLGLIRASGDIDEAGAAEAADILGISGSYRPESWEKDYVAPTAKEKREDAREKRKESSPSYIAREKRKEERKERIEERKKR